MNPGEKVQVFNRPLQHKELEGIAVLVEPAQPLTVDPDMGERWLVKFVPGSSRFTEPPSDPVIRWVHRSDRVEI